MALSIILRRSASRKMCGGNRFYGNLIVPSAFRQFCSSPSLSSKDSESVAKRPSLDESLVKDLISQVQSLQRDIELLRNSHTKSLLAVKEDDSLVGVDESESSFDHKGIDDDSSLKGIAIESSNEEVKDSQSDDSSSDDSSSDDSSTDDSKKSSSDSESDNSNDDSLSETDDSNDESLSETDDNNGNSDKESFSESGDTLPERDDNSESGDTLPEPQDESLPKSKENQQLLKGIESEILSAKTFMELSARGAVFPDDFPFEIGHNLYMPGLVLRREYEGELLVLQVENPTIFTNRTCSNYNEKKSSPFSMDLTVVVRCLSSKSIKVELKCCARPEGISVYRAMDPEATGTEVHMSELSENLKQEFGKYLEARGVTLSTTNLIYGYMLDKGNKERLRILENIKKMVS